MLAKLMGKFQPAKGQAESTASHNTPPNAPAQPVSASLVMRDVYVAENGTRTLVEVWTNGIKLTNLRPDASLPDDLTGASEAGEAPLETIPEETRHQVALKIAQLLPELGGPDLERLQTYMLRVLKQMAEDQAARVRRIVVEELQGAEGIPSEVVEKIAAESDQSFALQVLEHAPLLGDAVWLDILASSRHPAIMAAISRRYRRMELAAAAANAPKETASPSFTGVAEPAFSASVIDYFASRTLQESEWLGPLTQRDELTLHSLNRIARILTYQAMEALAASGALPKNAVEHLHSSVQLRLRNAQLDREKSALEKIKRLKEKNALNETAILEALDAGEYEVVLQGLVELTGYSLETIKRILALQTPKAVIALTWKAGFSMRASIPFQLRLARIPHTLIVYAKGGTDYPFSAESLQYTLSHFSE